MSFKGFLRGAADVAGGAVKLLGPATSGFLLGGPAGAGIAVASQVAAAAEKRRGKARENRTGRPVHKATAPAAAVVIPVGISLGLQVLGIPGPSPQEAAEIGGAVVLNHVGGHGLQDAARGRRI